MYALFNSSKLGTRPSRDSRKFKKKFTSSTLLSLSTQHSDDSAIFYHLIVVVSAAVLSFCGNIDGGFVFDDREAILKNKAVRSAQEILRTDFWGQPIRSSNSHKSFRPVTTLTFGLNYALSGLHSASYHIVNIALHAAVCLLLYKLLFNLSSIFQSRNPRSIAFQASLIFAVHPIHSEAVASIVGRAELLMALFSLATLHLYIESWSKSRFSIPTLAILLLLSILALFSKEQGIVALPLCAVFDVLASKISPKQMLNALRSHVDDTECRAKFAVLTRCACIRRLAMCSLVCTTLLILRFYINGFQSPQFSAHDNAIAHCSSKFFRVINYSYIYMRYLWLLIYPVHLCFDYSMGCIPLIETASDPRSLISASFLIIVFLFIVQLVRGSFEQYRLELFAIIFYVTAFLPASNIFVTVGFILAERVLYLPSVAFCLLAASLFDILVRFCAVNNRENVLKSGMTMILLMFLSKSFKRSTEWRSELALYKSGLDICPTNAKIHYNIAKIMAYRGDVGGAAASYADAIRLNPSYEQAMNNLANIYLRHERSNDAEQLLRKAIEIRPNFAAAWMNLGLALLAQKRFEEAQNSFEKALSLRFPYPDCLYNMGLLYLHQNKKEYAKQIWQNVTREMPNHKRAWLNLLILLDETGNCGEVLSIANEVLVYHSSDASILSQLGICSGKLGQYGNAEKFMLEAVQLDKTNALYWNNIGTLYQRWGKYKKAEFAYRKALRLQSQTETARRYMKCFQ